MTMSSLYSNGLHSYQISMQQSRAECKISILDMQAATVWYYQINND